MIYDGNEDLTVKINSYPGILSLIFKNETDKKLYQIVVHPQFPTSVQFKTSIPSFNLEPRQIRRFQFIFLSSTNCRGIFNTFFYENQDELLFCEYRTNVIKTDLETILSQNIYKIILPILKSNQIKLSPSISQLAIISTLNNIKSALKMDFTLLNGVENTVWVCFNPFVLIILKNFFLTVYSSQEKTIHEIAEIFNGKGLINESSSNNFIKFFQLGEIFNVLPLLLDGNFESMIILDNLNKMSKILYHLNLNFSLLPLLKIIKHAKTPNKLSILEKYDFNQQLNQIKNIIFNPQEAY